jgi:hypothetical protein
MAGLCAYVGMLALACDAGRAAANRKTRQAIKTKVIVRAARLARGVSIQFPPFFKDSLSQ